MKTKLQLIILICCFSMPALAGPPSCPTCKEWSSSRHECVPIHCSEDCSWCVGGYCRVCGGDITQCCTIIGCLDKCGGGSEGPCCANEGKFCCTGGSGSTCCIPAVEKCCDGKCYDELMQGCCDGTVYNKDTEKCCSEGEDQWVCPKNNECCEGKSCEPPCQIVDGQSCSGSDDNPCGMTCALPGGLCAQPSQKVWHNITEKKCDPRGCLNDCNDSTDWCWKVYDCVKDENVSVWFTQCSNICFGKDGMPIYMAYHVCCNIDVTHCYSCKPSSEPSDSKDVDMDSCG